MRRGGLLVMAMVSALWGAPSSASAAVTELGSPQVSPLAADGTASRAPNVPVGVAPESDADSGGIRRPGEDTVWRILLAGLAGVASVAAVGTLLLLASRRRGPRPAAGALWSEAGDALVRRAARTGRAHSVDDPILAALGVDDEMAARRAIRHAGRQLHEEDAAPGERPGKR